MKDENKNQKRDLPATSDHTSKLNDKLALFKKERAQRLVEKDPAFLEPLTPEAPKDERAPLERGGIDGWFLLWAVLLVCLGAVMSYSASAVYAEREYGSATYYLWRYILFAVGASVGTAFFVALARPWFWRIFGVLAYGGSMILLLLVLVIGAAEGVAQRWIDLGFVTLQPSEISKMAVV